MVGEDAEVFRAKLKLVSSFTATSTLRAMMMPDIKLNEFNEGRFSWVKIEASIFILLYTFQYWQIIFLQLTLSECASLMNE